MKDKLNRRSINIYEFGDHTGEPYKYESLHVFNYFIQLKAEKTISNLLVEDRPIASQVIGQLPGEQLAYNRIYKI